MKTVIKFPNILIVISLLLSLIGSVFFVTPAYAANIDVTTTSDAIADDGECSLREAIIAANTNTPSSDTSGTPCAAGSDTNTDTITLVNGATYSLTIAGSSENASATGDLDIIDNTAALDVILTVAGGGTATISQDASPDDRVLQIRNAATVVEITGITFSGGDTTLAGGGIHNAGTLTLTNSSVSGNTATLSAGGGIHNAGSLTLINSSVNGNTGTFGAGINNDLAATLTITNSTISSNVAGSDGGGIHNAIDATLTITNSTISSNEAGDGGGIYNNNADGTVTITASTINGNTATDGGGIYNDGGDIILANSTITGNTATGDGGGTYNSNGSMDITNVTISANSASGDGGGLYDGSDNGITIFNTIIALQTSGDDCYVDVGFDEEDFNIDSDGTCDFTNTNDQQNVTSADLALSPLANNGGPTQTMSINNTSAAFNAGDNDTCAASPVSNVDQRSVTRPQVGQCDIGAFEAGADFIATKTNSVGGTAVLNQTFNWIITVQQIGNVNLGIGDARVILADELPDSGATYGTPTLQNSSGVTGTVTCSITGFDLECVTNGLVTFLRDSSFQIVIPVTPTAIGTLENPGSGDFVCAVDPANNVTETFEDNNDCADTVTVVDSAASSLPDTGFAPNRITSLPTQSTSYVNLGSVWLEIPKLGVKSEIVGVPQSANGWNVDWLGNSIGWLNGTAFPSWEGNSVITGHVYDANGLPGPFQKVKNLKSGDQVIVHMFGEKYIFEVRESEMVFPSKTSYALQHLEGYSYLTLITCQWYNPITDSYAFRRVVRAVLIDVQGD